MRWQVVDKTQEPTALLMDGLTDPLDFLLEIRVTKPAFFGQLEVAMGDRWAIIFGQNHKGEILLPHIAQARALYKDKRNIWLPTGVDFDLDEDTQQDYIVKIRQDYDLAERPLILVPDIMDETENPSVKLFCVYDQVALETIVEPVS